MMTKQIKAASILAVLATVFSIIAFAVPFPLGVTFWTAYISGILAIALQMPIFKLAFDDADELKSKVLGYPVFRVGYIYLGVQMILSFALFGLAFVPIPWWISVLTCVLVLAAAIVCSIAADIAREEVQKIEYTQKKDTEFIKLMRVRSQNLANENKDEKLSVMLDELSEKFRYSDPVSSNATKESETRIDIMFSELEMAVRSGDKQKSQVIYEKLNAIIDSRNNICKLNK